MLRILALSLTLALGSSTRAGEATLEDLTQKHEKMARCIATLYVNDRHRSLLAADDRQTIRDNEFRQKLSSYRQELSACKMYLSRIPADTDVAEIKQARAEAFAEVMALELAHYQCQWLLHKPALLNPAHIGKQAEGRSGPCVAIVQEAYTLGIQKSVVIKQLKSLPAAQQP